MTTGEKILVLGVIGAALAGVYYFWYQNNVAAETTLPAPLPTTSVADTTSTTSPAMPVSVTGASLAQARANAAAVATGSPTGSFQTLASTELAALKAGGINRLLAKSPATPSASFVSDELKSNKEINF